MSFNPQPAGKTRVTAALLFVCLLWALDGLGPDLFPVLRRTALPPMERQAFTYALFALFAAMYAIRRQAGWPNRRGMLAGAGVGLLMFALPAVLASVTQGWVSQLERVAIFSLAPVFAAAMEPHIGSSSRQSNGAQSDGALMASLIAVAGALAIFPLAAPGSPAAFAAALVVIAASACAALGNCVAVHLAVSMREVSFASVAGVAGAVAAAAFAAVGACTEHTEWQIRHSPAQMAWLVSVDLPALMLLFWLLRRMSAVRMTTRFLLAPWFTVLAGIAFEQPVITLRVVLGVVLLGAGAGWLLLAPEVGRDEEPIGIL
jgi:drug/metabolite transporter (DMT)-like permease